MGTRFADSLSLRPGSRITLALKAPLSMARLRVSESGRPVFRDLLLKRRECVFIAFDLLFLNGKDLRVLPLLARKAVLKKLLKRNDHESFTSITSKVTAVYYSIKSLQWTWKESSASGKIRLTR